MEGKRLVIASGIPLRETSVNEQKQVLRFKWNCVSYTWTYPRTRFDQNKTNYSLGRKALQWNGF